MLTHSCHFFGPWDGRTKQRKKKKKEKKDRQRKTENPGRDSEQKVCEELWRFVISALLTQFIFSETQDVSHKHRAAGTSWAQAQSFLLPLLTTCWCWQCRLLKDPQVTEANKTDRVGQLLQSLWVSVSHVDCHYGIHSVHDMRVS